MKLPLITPPWVMSGGPDKPPKHAAPWLRIRVAIRHSERRQRSVLIPELGYAGGDQGGGYGYVWERLSKTERLTYRMLGGCLERYPAATLPGLEGSSQPSDRALGGALGPLSIALSSAFGCAASLPDVMFLG